MTENVTIRASPPQAVAEHGSCVLARRPPFVKCAVNSVSGKSSQLSVACGAGAGRERLEETVVRLQLQSKGRLNRGSANPLSFPQPSRCSQSTLWGCLRCQHGSYLQVLPAACIRQAASSSQGPEEPRMLNKVPWALWGER